MKKILIIPHHPLMPNIKLRLIEIAKNFCAEYKAYVVNWRAAEGRFLRAYSGLKDIFNKIRFYRQDSLNFIEFPILHRPLCLVPKFNSFWLKKIIERENIDIVINGSYYMFAIAKKRNFKYIFDIADLPAIETKTDFGRFIYKQIKIELEKADTITVSSRGLLNYVFNNFQKKAIFIPNGADIVRLRNVDEKEIDKVRQRYNLSEKWVIGYIGRIGDWINIDLLVEVFKEIRKDINNAVLLIVGDCPPIIKRKFFAKDIIFTGGINPKEIYGYYAAIDLGVVPAKKSLFQDLAFHIKVIEYTAARKFIISTPLEEMELLNFPNLIFAKEEKKFWIEAINKIRHREWSKEWDSLVDDYDWPKITKKLENIF